MTVRVLLSVLFIATSLPAQETWRGLRFGMTIAETAAVLSTPFSGEPSLKVPAEIAGCPGSGLLSFQNGKLSMIELRVVEDKKCRDDGPGHRYRSEVRDAFKLKYGKPVSVNRTRDGRARSSIWRLNGQTIELRADKRNHWVVVYRPVTDQI